ncbi:hypothetical protein BHJ80_24580 (plasmid) [Escherichia coli]|nr:hypothetical protein BHJ80_24580 [Escherichia coli]
MPEQAWPGRKAELPERRGMRSGTVDAERAAAFAQVEGLGDATGVVVGYWLT